MSKTIDILKEIALKEYYDYGKGVNYVIKADPYFAKNNANRMKGVRSGGTFNMYHMVVFPSATSMEILLRPIGIESLCTTKEVHHG